MEIVQNNKENHKNALSYFCLKVELEHFSTQATVYSMHRSNSYDFIFRILREWISLFE
jgi:hypothetical protein